MPKGAKPGERWGGRPKGALNHLTQSVKQAIEIVAEGLGGAERMLAWVQADKANERLFWSQIYPKLLPKEIKAEHHGPNGEALRFGVLAVPVLTDEWEGVAAKLQQAQTKIHDKKQ